MSTIATTASQAQSQYTIDNQDIIDALCGIEPGTTPDPKPLNEAIQEMRETNPAFAHGWLLDDYDRRRMQASAYEDVYYASIRMALKRLELREGFTNNGVTEDSNLLTISRAILHGVLSELCQAPEAWKSIPSRYILKDKAMKETGLPINMGWACRTANVLAQCVHDRFGGGWHITATFYARNGEPGYVALSAERQDSHTDIFLGGFDFAEVEEGLRESFVKSALFGAFKAGAKDASKCSGALSTPHGTILIEVADAVEPDSFSAMWL